MSEYDQTLSITVPLAQRETGKRISRALDPDIGGYYAFTQFLDADMQPCDEADAVYTTYSTPCTSPFKARADHMLANPEAMYAAVSADYATRWTEFEAPTMAECVAFCAGVVLS